MPLMLVLSRKKGQSIMIGNNIEISIIDIQGEQIRLGINAPRDIPIHRKEVFEEIIQENRQAASTPIGPDVIRQIKVEKK
jgi:carbon storage regulator